MEVRVVGITGVPVLLRAVDNTITNEQRCITGEAGADICRFSEIVPGNYIVSPEGLNLSLPLTIKAGIDTQIIFDLEVLPPGITGWQSRVINNTNGVEAIARGNGIISARIEGRAGQIVSLSSIRGTEKNCETTFNPLLDGFVCEFGGLEPGVYLVEVLHTGARRRVFVDGRGRADLLFSPNATYATEAVGATPASHWARGRACTSHPPNTDPNRDVNPAPSTDRNSVTATNDHTDTDCHADNYPNGHTGFCLARSHRRAD